MMKRKPYSLSNLVAQCDPSASVPDELRAWEQAAPVGIEQMVMINQVDIREAILKFSDFLSKEFDVVQLALYGSRARGDYRAESDTNVAVLLHGE
jgi:antitoxin ChpS